MLTTLWCGRHRQHGGPADHHHRPGPHQGRVRRIRYRHGVAHRYDLRRLLRDRRVSARALGGRRLTQGGAGGLSRILEPDEQPLAASRKSFIQLAITRVGVAIGEAGASPTSQSMLSDLFPLSSRATVLATLSAFSSFGIGLGVPAGWLAIRHVHLAHGVFHRRSTGIAARCVCLPVSARAPGAAPPMAWWTIGKTPGIGQVFTHLRKIPTYRHVVTIAAFVAPVRLRPSSCGGPTFFSSRTRHDRAPRPESDSASPPWGGAFMLGNFTAGSSPTGGRTEGHTLVPSDVSRPSDPPSGSPAACLFDLRGPAPWSRSSRSLPVSVLHRLSHPALLRHRARPCRRCACGRWPW